MSNWTVFGGCNMELLKKILLVAAFGALAAASGPVSGMSAIGDPLIVSIHKV